MAAVNHAHPDAPVIETARLRMRGHRIDDLDDCVAMRADPEVMRHLGGKQSSREESWSRILRYAGLWALLGYGYWAVEEKASGRFVGDVGFADFKRTLTPSFDGAPELGWTLALWSHGRGFATEAAQAAINWGSAHFGPVRTVCLIHPDNAASLRVAEKCGYRAYASTTYKDEPALLFER